MDLVHFVYYACNGSLGLHFSEVATAAAVAAIVVVYHLVFHLSVVLVDLASGDEKEAKCLASEPF